MGYKKCILRLVALAIFGVMVSCASAPKPDEPGESQARILGFTIVSTENPYAKLAPISCEIVEGADSGIIRGILPGGTDPRIKANWKISRGTLWAGGERFSRIKLFDLGSTDTLMAVDSSGRIRRYRLQITTASIPTIYVRTDYSAPILSKTDWVEGEVAIAGGTYPWAKALPKAEFKIRGRGNSTWGMAKKPYRFTLDTAAPLLGLTAAKKWVLLANYADKSLMRNFVAFKTAESLKGLRFSPHQYPVLLYLNDEYLGVYGLGEQVETGKGRVDIGKPDETPATPFLLEVNMRIDSEAEGGVLGKDFFMTPGGLKLEYKTPDSGEIKNSQKSAIESAIVKAEKAILAGQGYAELIDVESFIDWLIMEEVFKNQDSNFLSSVYLHRTAGGKIAIGPIWDFDLAAGNSDYGSVNGYEVKDPKGWFARYSTWYGGLLGSPEFTNALVARWSAVRASLEKAVFTAIGESSAILSDVQRDNFARWPIMGIYVWPNPPELVAAKTHAAQVEALAVWFRNRFQWIDKEIASIAF